MIFRRNNAKKWFNPEAEEQIKFVRFLKICYPDTLFTISPSGIKMPLILGAKFKMMGYKKGTSDILIFEPRKGYHGLFIEMKTPKTFCTEKGSLSKDQKMFIQEAEKRGYKSVVCYGSKEAVEVFQDYMDKMKEYNGAPHIISLVARQKLKTS